MADLRDEHGNPVQLADQYGKPVQLTDEYGNPMHITGVATTQTVGGLMARERHDQLHHPCGDAATQAPPQPQQEQLHSSDKTTHEPPQLKEQLSRSSSSSSSSEDDGQGGRRKKKGLKEKIKETFGGGNKHNKDKGEVAHGTASATTTHVSSTTEKKGVLSKIKDNLPGHHHNP